MTPMMTSPSTMIVNRPKRSTIEWGRRHRHHELLQPTEDDERDGPRQAERRPHDDACLGGDERAGADDRDGGHHARHVGAGEPSELPLPPHGVPEPAHHREQERVHDRERGAILTWGVGGEHRHMLRPSGGTRTSVSDRPGGGDLQQPAVEIHASQIIANTTANSAAAPIDTCSARWWAAWLMTATYTRS